MRFRIYELRFAICAAGVLALGRCRAPAQSTNGTNVFSIDLPTTLRLAGAQNLDVQLARAKLAEARAAHEGAVEQLFPWLAPGVAYHRRDGSAQFFPAGNVIDNAHLESYAPGGTVAAQADWGNALFAALQAHQLVRAASHALDAQRQDSLLAAAQGFFDLAEAQAGVGVAREAVRISADYENQLHRAVSAGVAFHGDELRVATQTERDRLLLRQVQEQQRVAAARLSETLHLDATIELVPQETELVPLNLVQPDTPLGALVSQALVGRPELKQSQALLAAARAANNGATYGPLLPTLGAQVFVGGFGGGPAGQHGEFGAAQDYFTTLSWRVGPGGLFDPARRHGTRAQLSGAQFAREKIRDQITREVVETATRVRSLSDQIATARRALTNAEGTLRLTLERKEFGVGIVLENIQAQQDLTRARSDYLQAVAEFDKAQYALRTAVGLTDTPEQRTAP